VGQTLLEYRVLRRVIRIQSGFSGEIDCGQVPLDKTWRVDQISVGLFGEVAILGLSGQPVLVYDQPQGLTSSNDPALNVPTVPVDATVLLPVNSSGTLVADFNDRGSPITVLGGDELAIVFPASLSVGWVAVLRVQYGVYQGTAGAPTPIAS
jgi:hypothetical protein